MKLGKLIGSWQLPYLGASFILAYLGASSFVWIGQAFGPWIAAAVDVLLITAGWYVVVRCRQIRPWRPIVRESLAEALENDGCARCGSADHFAQDCPPNGTQDGWMLRVGIRFFTPMLGDPWALDGAHIPGNTLYQRTVDVPLNDDTRRELIFDPNAFPLLPSKAFPKGGKIYSDIATTVYRI